MSEEELRNDVRKLKSQLGSIEVRLNYVEANKVRISDELARLHRIVADEKIWVAKEISGYADTLNGEFDKLQSYTDQKLAELKNLLNTKEIELMDMFSEMVLSQVRIFNESQIIFLEKITKDILEIRDHVLLHTGEKSLEVTVVTNTNNNYPSLQEIHDHVLMNMPIGLVREDTTGNIGIGTPREEAIKYINTLAGEGEEDNDGQ